MKKVVFGHKSPDTDSICSALTYALGEKEQGIECEALRLGELSKETEYVLDKLRIVPPRLVTTIDEDCEVVLVDHNESGQSIDNVKKLNVVEVYDHHRLYNFETENPIKIDIQPVGCTSTVLYNKYKNEGISITKDMASLMLSAIISDTLLFKSPTTTKKDNIAARELQKISGLDIKEHGMSLLKAGTNLDDVTTERLLDLDTKKFEVKDGVYEIGQINTVDIEQIKKDRGQEIKKAINGRIKNNDLDAFVFVMTDIVNSNSEAYILGRNAQSLAQKFNVTINDEDIMKLPGVVSRKKQIVPFL